MNNIVITEWHIDSKIDSEIESRFAVPHLWSFVGVETMRESALRAPSWTLELLQSIGDHPLNLWKPLRS